MGARMLLLAGVLGAAGIGAPAFAQQSTADLCRAMPSADERFACLENALAAAEAALAAAQPDQGEAASAAAAEDEREGGLRIGIPFLGGGGDDASRPASVVGTGLGEEQVSPRVRTAEADEAAVQAQAVSYRERVPGQWQFELSNGEIWRQVSGDSTPLALYGREPLDVEISRSWAGGYRMRLIELGPRIQVERVR